MRAEDIAAPLEVVPTPGAAGTTDDDVDDDSAAPAHELLWRSGDVSPSERLLLEVAQRGAVTGARLGELELALTKRIASQLNGDVRGAAASARILKDLVALNGSLCRRVQDALSTASTLRIQRQHFSRAK